LTNKKSHVILIEIIFKNGGFMKFLYLLTSLFLFSIPMCSSAAEADRPSSLYYLSRKEKERYPLFTSFLTEHILPKKYRIILSHRTEKESYSSKLKKIPFYAKKDITRIINAQRMKLCIKKNNLFHLAVTEKYVGKIDSKWAIFSRRIEGVPITELTAPVTKFNKEVAIQLCTLAKETGFCDWGSKSPNWIRTEKDGKDLLVCIDTEQSSFADNSLESLNELSSNWSDFFTEEALNFLEEQRSSLEKENSVPSFESYDNPNYPAEQLMDECCDLFY
jgi:hypothetical protein